jgi:hypothetical protein
MKNSYRTLLLLLFSLGLFSFTNSPIDDINKIINKLTDYVVNSYQEKIYLHFDKPFYGAGETIWFKAYCTNASLHWLDSSSKVVYVEIYDPNNKLLEKKLLLTKSGVANGDFKLSDSLAQGTYTIRAYTNFQRNFLEEYYFDKEFYVLATKAASDNKNIALKSNLKKNIASVQTISGKKLDLQFLAEGGNFLADQDNRLAFKALTPSGKSIEVEGDIFDEKDVLIQHFKTEHYGIGLVDFHPLANKKYYAKVTNLPDEKFDLPEVVSSGYMLKVVEMNHRFHVIVARNATNNTLDDNVFLIAHIRGNIYHAGIVKLSDNVGLAKVPKSTFLSSGIIHFTIFDKNLMPLCERLSFINRQENISFQVSSPKNNYTKREAVDLNILAKDKKGTPIEGNFSLSIYDTKSDDTTNHPIDINTYMLLTSDLKGSVEDPGYYFKDTSVTTRQHTDMLMMTHGWSRFDWKKDILSDSIIKFAYQKEKSLSIGGQVLKVIADKPAIGSQVVLMIKNGDLVIAKTNNEAKFFIKDLFFYDTTAITIQTNNENKKITNYRLKLNPINQSPEFKYVPKPIAPIDATAFLVQNKYRNNVQKKMFGSETVVLDEIEIRKKKRTVDINTNTTIQPYGTADFTIKGEDMANSNMPNIMTYLQGNVPGLNISGSGDDMIISIRGSSDNPALFLDGAPITIDIFQTLNMENIEKLDVIKTGDLGAQGANGAIYVYSKKGNNALGNYEKFGITNLIYQGFYKAKTFYSPRYDVPDTLNLPDIRTTLYWNPEVKTDASGKAKVSFWTSDVNSTYKIVIEGMNAKGLIGAGNSTLNVLK